MTTNTINGSIQFNNIDGISVSENVIVQAVGLGRQDWLVVEFQGSNFHVFPCSGRLVNFCNKAKGYGFAPSLALNVKQAESVRGNFFWNRNVPTFHSF